MARNVAVDTIVEGVKGVLEWLRANTRAFAQVLTFFGPMLFLVLGAAAVRLGWEDDFAVVVLFGAAVLYALLTLFLRGYANRTNRGDSFPLPVKRFTSVHDDGQVDVSYDRVQEMILYVADVEDWAERKGRARWK